MAPSSSTPTKALQHNQPRPTVRKAVVPVIPITYMQARKKVVELEKAKQQAGSEVFAEDAVSSPSLPIKTPSTGSPDTPNASHAHDDSKKSSPVVSVLSTNGLLAQGGKGEEQSGSNPQGNIHERSSSVPSDPPSSASQTTFHMPPPLFVPSHPYRPCDLSPEQHQSHPPQMSSGQLPTHHAHPSGNSLIFGGNSDSNASSPAPQTSAGFGPPALPFQHPGAFHRPAFPIVNGGHLPHPSNNFVPMDPRAAQAFFPRSNGLSNQQFGGTGFDRRPAVMFGPTETISPSANPLGTNPQGMATYAPSTPQSLHGSQPSTVNDQDDTVSAFYGQYPTALASNGSNGQAEDLRVSQMHRSQLSEASVTTSTPTFPPPGVPQPGVQLHDHVDGLVIYLQSQFANPYLADYNIELRYADDRSCPVRIPGHSIILARSPTLKKLMDAQSSEPTSDGPAVKTLLIASEDRFLRSDAFWMAVQRLYGGPLLNHSVFAAMSAAQPPPLSPGSISGSSFDHFDLGLGYAAAGRILRIPVVMDRGGDIAAEYVSWETLEKAFVFALDGGLDSIWFAPCSTPYDLTGQSNYGPIANKMIFRALEFIVANFPPHFELDTIINLPEFPHRLPLTPEELKQTDLSSIRFGDHTVEGVAPRAISNSTNVLISKILLDLPFPLLKYILENFHLGHNSGGVNSTLRRKVMQNVIAERERRRVGVYQRTIIANQQRKEQAPAWNAVGFREIVVPLSDGSNEVAKLQRNWVDFVFPNRA